MKDNILSVASELVERYGNKRFYGWFDSVDGFPRDFDLWFLKHALEQLGFNIVTSGGSFPFTLDQLCNYWEQLKTSKNPVIDKFVQGKWTGQKGFGAQIGPLLEKEYNDIYQLRLQYIKGGAKGLRLFRALLKNAWNIRNGQFVDISRRFEPIQYGSFLEFLKDRTKEYLKFQLKIDNDKAQEIMSEFPYFRSLRDEDFQPKSYARFLENQIVNAHISYVKAGTHFIKKAFSEIGLNTASYALRDIAVRGGEQILRGTEHCFKVDSNTKKFVLKKGLLYRNVELSSSLAIERIDHEDVLRKSVWYERKVHQMLLDAIIDTIRVKYPSMTPAKLNERFYLYIQDTKRYH